MNKKYVIAHDIGTGSVKTAIITTDGDIICSASESYPFFYPQPGWVEQKPDDYWNASVKSTRNVMKESGISPEEVLGIVFTTQAMGIIPIDAEGNVLRNNITWVDGRAEEQARWIMNLVGGPAIFKKIVGIEITGKDVLPKLRWLKQKEPEVYREMDKVLDVNGYLKFRATGKKVFEWSGACSYIFNLKKKDWERLFFRAAGFDTSKLPGLVRSVDIMGTLTPEASEELGLPIETPVFGGCDDTQSAAIGSGSAGEGKAHIYLGTSAWAGVTTAKNLKFKNGAVCLQSADPSMNLLVGITESAGSNLDWLIEKFYKLEKEDPKVKNIYEFVNCETADIPPGSDHLVFTPWLLGERCPVSSTTTRGTVFNLSLEHTRGHFVNAMLEGIGYNLRWILENYRQDFRFNIRTLRAIGGGSINDKWMQGIADITGCRVETTSQPKMAGAIGAAMCAFVGSGIFQKFESVNNIIKVKKQFDPNPENRDIYNELFVSYKNIYKGLKKAYIKANGERFR